MDETGVLETLEDLTILLEDSKPVFGKSNLRQVDINEALAIIDEIRDRYPGEYAESRRILREREALIEDARQQANSLIANAHQEVLTISSEMEVVRVANQKAAQIEAEAREMQRQIHTEAEEYAEKVFSHVEQSLDALLNNVQRCRDRLNANASIQRR